MFIWSFAWWSEILHREVRFFHIGLLAKGFAHDNFSCIIAEWYYSCSVGTNKTTTAPLKMWAWLTYVRQMWQPAPYILITAVENTLQMILDESIIEILKNTSVKPKLFFVSHICNWYKCTQVRQIKYIFIFFLIKLGSRLHLKEKNL